MAQKELENVKPLTEQEYAKTFSSFISCTNEYDAMTSIARRVIQENNFDTNPVRMLSIGAGRGNFEVTLVRELNLKLEYIYAIEPNLSHVEVLVSALQSIGVKHDISTAHFTEKSDLTEIADGDHHKFDFIMFSHSLYHFNDPYEIIIHASNFLKPKGKLLIFNLGDKSTTTEMYNFLLNRMPEVFRKTIADYSLTPEKIVRNVRERDSTLRLSVMEELAHVQCDNFIRKIETLETNDAVSFLLQTNYKSLSNEAQQCVYEIVAAACELKEGKFWMRHPSAGVLVFRESN